MTEAARITVAIPTCNGARHLAEALRGILAQTGADFDLIVSDDRSDDETIAIVRELAGDRARLEVNSERLGLAGNWNRCVALARTDWVAVFHQDDVMRPGHLAAHRSILTNTIPTTFGMVAGPAEAIDDVGRPVPPQVVEPGDIGIRGVMPHDAQSIGFPPGEFTRFLTHSNPLRCSAVIVRRSAHADVGGFDPSYRYVVDWDFWLRVARRWSVSWRLGPPTVAFRWHAASETHRFKTGTADLEEQVRLLAGLYEQLGPEAARSLRSAANRRLARAFLNRSYDAARAGDRSLSSACLRRAWSLAPGVVLRGLADPRLAARLLFGRS